MSKKIAVIADDFTGANDTGVQFSKKNLKTEVIFEIDKIKAIPSYIKAAVIDTESRADPAKLAYQKVYQAVKKLKLNGFDYVYKKLDSTLRGNIGAEIEAAFVGGGFKSAVIVPALPSNGRKTIGGVQFVGELPLEKTEISQDPVTPIKYSSIAEIIHQESNQPTALINLKDVLKGEDNILLKLKLALKKEATLIIVDAITETDLIEISRAALKLKPRPLFVGSAGLASALANNLNLKNKKLLPKKEIVAGIVGSVSEISRSQVKYAVEKLPNLKLIEFDLTKILSDSKAGERDRLKSIIKSCCKNKQDFIIQSARTRKLVKQAFEFGSKHGLNKKDVTNIIAKFMGQLASYIYQLVEVKGLFITGGEIAIRSAQSISAQANIIEEEVLPGIPLSYFAGEDLPVKPVVTKAGAFGEKEAIVEVFIYLKE